MAAKSKSTSSGSKIVFGKKSKKGNQKKKFGPKEKRPKKYRGQGK
jgi:hypothetical protein